MSIASTKRPRRRSRTAGIRRVDGPRGVRYEARWREASGKERSRSFPSEDAAKAYLERVRMGKRDGSYVSPEKSRTPFRELADAWVATREHDPKVRQRTLDGYRRELRLHILPTFGDLPIGAIDSRAVEVWLAELRRSKGHRGGKQSIKPGTVVKVYTRLRAVLAYARRHNYIVGNPCDALDVVDDPQPSREDEPGEAYGRFLSRAQVQAIAGELVAVKQPVYALLVQFMAQTGLRASEIVGLRIRDVRLRDRVVHVRRTVKPNPWRVEETKNRRRRTVPLLDDALHADLTKYLATHPHRDDLDAAFWPGRTRAHELAYGTGGDPHYLDHQSFFRNHFRPAVKRAGLPAKPRTGVRAHDLRHTAISQWLADGQPIYDASRWAGHSSIAFTDKVYAHYAQAPDYTAALARHRTALALAESSG